MDAISSASSPTSPPGEPQSTFSAAKHQAHASLQVFVTSTVTSLGKRITKWRTHKGGDFTGDDFKDYCLETGITQEFAATINNTPQKIGASELVGRTLCRMARCMLTDGGLLPNLWRGPMMTAFYLCNRIPHSVLKMETPCKMLFRKDADIYHLRIIGARALVHIKHAKKLDHTLWEGMVHGFGQNESSSFRNLNPNTRRGF